MRSVFWFRNDLRRGDNPGLAYAARRGEVVPVYVLEEPPAGRPMGAASRWWLHHSLAALAKELGGLVLLRGDPARLLPELAKRTGADGVFWSRSYEPAVDARDERLKKEFRAGGLEVGSFNASLLFEPWRITSREGKPFRVFTAFWRACGEMGVEASGQAAPIRLVAIAGLGARLEDWDLLPAQPNWALQFEKAWAPGEEAARRALAEFVATRLADYAEMRNRPDCVGTSLLSPHLHFGEISPRQVWQAALARQGADKFLAELGWREFTHHLLYQFPDMPARNFRAAFDAFPWLRDKGKLKAWQRGMTGYPIVDAGMRQLWATGYMHNRVRMVVASFLVKHLRIDWREGEAWFWDTLVDADLANNAGNWQWVAGSGADAAPYFRIFNPMEQGRKFDPEGAYVRRWCPELARVPLYFLHAPWLAPAELLKEAGVVLGRDYPEPIVDHAQARAAALAGFERVKRAE